MSDAFFLGAGFSNAISDAMPVLSRLTSYVFDARFQAQRPTLGDDTDEALGHDIEAFLTHLATEAPWLDEATNLTKRAGFLKMSRLLATILLERQNEAIQSDPPPWLYPLLRRWHDDQSTVITLNYDTLIEKAVSEAVKVDGKVVTPAHLYVVPIPPIDYRTPGRMFGREPIETFRLLKLHGSLSWYYSGAEQFCGEAIYDIGFKYAWGPENRDDPAEVAARAPDKVPLVVPPTTSKSGFFNNETVRSQWRAARDALASADRHVYLGFSFPVTDQMLRFLVAPMSGGREAVVVNSARDKDQEELVARYKSVYPMGTVVEDYAGDTEAIPTWADEYLGSASAR